MPHPRTTRRKLAIGLGRAAATLAATAGLAFGQINNPPDGGPPQAPGPNVMTTACGPNQNSIVMVSLADGKARVAGVPQGATLLFSPAP